MRTHRFIELHGETALLVERKIVKAVPITTLEQFMRNLPDISSPILPLNTIRWARHEKYDIFYILRPAGRQKVTLAEDLTTVELLVPYSLFVVTVAHTTINRVEHYWLLAAPTNSQAYLFEPCFPNRFSTGSLCLDGTHMLDNVSVVEKIDALIDQIMNSVLNRELLDTALPLFPDEFRSPTEETGAPIFTIFKQRILRWADWSSRVPRNDVAEREAIQTIHWEPTQRPTATTGLHHLTLEEVPHT